MKAISIFLCMVLAILLAHVLEWLYDRWCAWRNDRAIRRKIGDEPP